MKRIITGLIFGLLLVGTILLRNVSLVFFDVFLGTAILLANLEMCNALSRRNRENIKYISLIHVVGFYVITLLSIKFEVSTLNYVLYQLYLLIAVALSAFVYFVIRKFVKNKKSSKKEQLTNKQIVTSSLKATLNTLLTCIYPNLILGLLFIINHIGEISIFKFDNSIEIGTFILVLIFLISFITDIFAYVVGTIFQGPKLCPTISPKKTISGAIGGLVFAVIANIIAFYVFIAISAYNELLASKNITMLTLIILAIIGSVATQCGDIFASLIKRRSNIKDFGNILPGHGGVLDRFDGVMFNTIVIFIYSCILLV